MRSQNLARALLRSAVRTGTIAAPAARATKVNLLNTATTTTNAVALRSFTSSTMVLKKKVKKNAFAAAEEDFVENESDEFAVEEDDLFGGISDAPSTSSSSPSSSASSSSSMSRVDFAQALESYRASLDWELIDRGRFPSLSRWRALAGQATTQAELEELLELAKIYRDRVGSLGVESGRRFASRAAAVKLPEVALNAFVDRYATGLEYDLESLYLVQSGLLRKLLRNDREEVLSSAELPGAPVQEADLLGVIAPTEGAQEGAEAQDAGDGKAEAISAEHELDMPLARAQLSIIDRMSILASLSAPSPTAPLDPLLVSYLPRAYISTFSLLAPGAESNPLLSSLFARTDSLIALLTSSAQKTLSNPSSRTTLPPKRSTNLGKNLGSALSYVAVRGGKVTAENGNELDPVRVLYRYMDRVGPQKSNELVRLIEPLLQKASQEA